MDGEEQTVPEEHADEASGTGGADSPEEAVGESPQREEAADQDAGPTKSAEQLGQEPERDKAEG